MSLSLVLSVKEKFWKEEGRIRKSMTLQLRKIRVKNPLFQSMIPLELPVAIRVNSYPSKKEETQLFLPYKQRKKIASGFVWRNNIERRGAFHICITKMKTKVGWKGN